MSYDKDADDDLGRYLAATCTCGSYIRDDHYCFSGVAARMTYFDWLRNGRKSQPNDIPRIERGSQTSFGSLGPSSKRDAGV